MELSMQRKSILKSLSRGIDRLLFFAFLLAVVATESFLLVYVTWLGAAVVVALLLGVGYYVATDSRRQQHRAARARQSRIEQLKKSTRSAGRVTGGKSEQP